MHLSTIAWETRLSHGFEAIWDRVRYIFSYSASAVDDHHACNLKQKGIPPTILCINQVWVEVLCLLHILWTRSVLVTSLFLVYMLISIRLELSTIISRDILAIFIQWDQQSICFHVWLVETAQFEDNKMPNNSLYWALCCSMRCLIGAMSIQHHWYSFTMCDNRSLMTRWVSSFWLVHAKSRLMSHPITWPGVLCCQWLVGRGCSNTGAFSA